MKLKIILISLVGAVATGCQSPKSVLEVTTFKTKPATNMAQFIEMDAEVEANFTSLQPGFIKRQSGLDDKGEFVVLVYWESMEDAEASMSKFMQDESVASYAGMIDGASMKMSRYHIKEGYEGGGSEFVEVMSYNVAEGVDLNTFAKTNKRVAYKVTAPKEGFVQRVTGVNDEERRVVVVYWDTKANSDAALQPFMENEISKEFMGMMDGSSVAMGRYQTLTSINPESMEPSNKEKVVALLNSFNTGDQAPIAYINPNKYIQHNLGVADGLEGFGAVMQHAPPQGFKANVIRAFEDGDYVFTHTEYDFFGPKAGFDVFRFEDGLIVEHWDNLLEVQPANPSGRTQFDGATEITDLDQTEANKKIARDFITKVLLNHEMDQLTNYISTKQYIQHNPAVADGLEGFGAAMKYFTEQGIVMEYTKLHKVLGEGNFVLTMSEGTFGKGEPTAFYDLFRIEDGLIVEHWDVIAPIPPKAEWKNDNGKF